MMPVPAGLHRSAWIDFDCRFSGWSRQSGQNLRWLSLFN
jgi:hypothetical protein